MKLEILVEKTPFLITAIADFNAKYTTQYNKNKTSFEGNAIDDITLQLGLHQLINKPTHILQNSTSCIVLVFLSQPNLVIELGVHSSLYSSCHYQIVFVKLNLKIWSGILTLFGLCILPLWCGNCPRGHITSLANALLMKPGQLVDQVKRGLLRLGYVVLQRPKIDQKCQNLMISAFFYSSMIQFS